MSCFEQKKNETGSSAIRVARNNGGLVDLPVSEMFANWNHILRPFNQYLKDDIQNLRKIPLGSKLTSNHPSLKRKHS